MSNTSIAENLANAEDKAAGDNTAKNLVAYKAVLAWTLKTTCKEFSDFNVDFIAENCIGDVSISEKAVHQDHPDREKKLDGDEKVTAMNSESSSKNEGSVYFDLRFRARVPGKDGDIFLILNIEVQNDDDTPYALVTRGIYYSARMISEQYGTVFKKSNYQKIQKVYSIWICPAPAEKKAGGILQYRIVEKEVMGKSFINEDDYDKMEVVVIGVGEGCDYSDRSITGLFSVLFSSKMELEEKKRILGGTYGIAMTEKFESEVEKMDGIGKAYEKAGRIDGLVEGQLRTLNNLIKNGKLSIEDAAESANMTVEEFQKKKEEYKIESL